MNRVFFCLREREGGGRGGDLAVMDGRLVMGNCGRVGSWLLGLGWWVGE